MKYLVRVEFEKRMLVGADQYFPYVIDGLLQDLGGMPARVFEIFNQSRDIALYFGVPFDAIANLLLIRS